MGEISLTLARPQSRQGNLLLVVLLGAQLMANIDTAIVNIALPSVQQTLRASAPELQLTVAGYLLPYAMFLITGARLGQARGYKNVFLIGLAGFTAASLACGLAINPVILIASRALQGVAAALLVPQVVGGIHREFTGAEKTRALGLYAIALSSGAVLGQALGAVLVTANIFGLTWRPVFLINVPVGIVLFWLGSTVLRTDGEPDRARFDIAGVAVLATTVLLLVVPLVFGRDFHWPPWCWLSLAVSFAGIMTFFRVERFVAKLGGLPLLRIEMLAVPGIASGLLAQFASTMTYTALLFTLAVYLQRDRGETALYSGLSLIPWVAAFGIAGRLTAKMRGRLTQFGAPLAYGVMALAYLLLAVSAIIGNAIGVTLWVLLAIGGYGFGWGYITLVARLTTIISKTYSADLSGVLTTGVQLAGVLGVAVFGSLYLELASPNPQRAMSIIFFCFAIVALGAVFAALRSVRGKDIDLLS